MLKHSIHTFKTDMLGALQHVITESGFAGDLYPGMHTKKREKAWLTAKSIGYVRRLTSDEIEAWLQTQRGVRTVLLGMLERSALDEEISPFYEDGHASLTQCSEALEVVVSNIHAVRHLTRRWYTLTPEGVAYLQAGEETT